LRAGVERGILFSEEDPFRLGVLFGGSCFDLYMQQ
jgi:hypothetical protein